MRILRSKRVRTPGIDAWLCTEATQLINISATGALVRSEAPLMAGRECPFILKAQEEPVSLWVRVVWTKQLPIETPNPNGGDEQFLVALRFTKVPPRAKAAVSALRGASSEWDD